MHFFQTFLRDPLKASSSVMGEVVRQVGTELVLTAGPHHPPKQVHIRVDLLLHFCDCLLQLLQVVQLRKLSSFLTASTLLTWSSFFPDLHPAIPLADLV